MALKQARHEKKNIMTYNEAESHMESVRDTVQYTYAIREAINNDRIVPHFQPIVDTTSRQIVKYEALMRLVDSKGSHLPPSAFLELSKKLKLYNFLSIRMMEKTIEVIKDTGHKVCINFDKEDILNNKIQERLFYLIKKYNLQGRITIEITESEGMDSVAELAAFVTRARQEGCLIAIDDFGTGYSNFMYILNLQPDFLKIDGSITRQIIDSRRAKLLTKTITEMCLSAGIKTVAEFVSSEEIYEEINSLGIDYCQGFLFGKASHNIKTD
jgi:EAL domain-containing protein (putative c-di-GMP-specific phosphodiesterase class I)